MSLAPMRHLTFRRIRRDWIDGLKVFYLGGLFAMPAVRTDELAELLGYCRQRGIVTVVNIISAQGDSRMELLLPLLPHTDYFLPNDDESERLTGFADAERQVETYLRHGVGSVVTGILAEVRSAANEAVLVGDVIAVLEVEGATTGAVPAIPWPSRKRKGPRPRRELPLRSPPHRPPRRWSSPRSRSSSAAGRLLRECCVRTERRPRPYRPCNSPAGCCPQRNICWEGATLWLGTALLKPTTLKLEFAR